MITGASRVEQVRENLAALQALERLTPEVKGEIDELFSPVTAGSR